MSAIYNHGNVQNCPLKYYLQGKYTEAQARENYYIWCINAGTADEAGLRARRKREADLFFSGVGEKTGWANVAIPKQHFKTGEEVVFTLTSDTGNSYTVGIDDESGNRIYTYNTNVDLDSTTQYYTHIFDKGDLQIKVNTHKTKFTDYS